MRAAMYLMPLDAERRHEALRSAAEPVASLAGYAPDGYITVDGVECPVYQPSDDRSYQYAVCINGHWYRYGYARFYTTSAISGNYTLHRGTF